jgi:hypothetical protein
MSSPEDVNGSKSTLDVLLEAERERWLTCPILTASCTTVARSTIIFNLTCLTIEKSQPDVAGYVNMSSKASSRRISMSSQPKSHSCPDCHRRVHMQG